MYKNKVIVLTLFTLLLSACDSSTVIDQNNTTPVIEQNNRISVIEQNNTIPEQKNIAVVYEDAENQKTDTWTISSNYSKEAQILNTYDDEKKSRVIYFDAKVTENNPYSFDTFRFDGINSSKSNHIIQWSMKFDQIFTISLNVQTKQGGRWLHYKSKDTGAGKYDDENIIHGIGSDKTNNQWHTIIRDLKRDVERYEPNNEFMKINYMTVRGGGYIDDISSYASVGTLDINKPVTVMKPGIVLTFDDSLVYNWEKMQDTFKEKGAVATFFCNRWADYSENWDIKDDEKRLLKSFQDNGHEIGFHTVKHLSTMDPIYDNEPNKAQAYFDTQITPGIEVMRTRGFEPKSFSYPYMSGKPAHNELIRQELPHIREFFAHVTLIDKPGNKSLEDIRKHLEKLKKDQDIGVFLSHRIFPKDFKDINSSINKYHITREKLISIMDMVNELGLEFYTLEEAHNIYMNQ